jgi:autonomous glycyl radical cofactor GrcA
MTMRTRLKISWAMALAVVTLAVGSRMSGQSLTYTKGQNVAPAYEGWEQDADGSKWFVFGYMNRNWVEELDVPPGPNNSFTPGGPDLGQPTHFLPRRNRFVFRVAVPKTFTDKDEMIWSLTTNGVTEKAWATIRADYLLDDVVKASETGALGAGTSSPELRSNVPPTVKVEGAKTLTATVGQPLTLTAIVKDDGIPKPPASANPLAALFGGATAAPAPATGERAAAPPAAPPAAPAAPASASAVPPALLLKVLGGQATAEERAAAAEALGVSEAQLTQLVAARRNPEMNPPARITVGKTRGLHLSWYVYRGAGKVTFSPEQVKTWEDTRAGMNSPWAPLWTPPRLPPDGKIVVQATFTEPGTYTLKALADDGALLGEDGVTVTVTK